MLSEERIDLLAIKHAPPVHPDYIGCDDWHEFARAIEREAYKQGQERMRERATSQATIAQQAERIKELERETEEYDAALLATDADEIVKASPTLEVK